MKSLSKTDFHMCPDVSLSSGRAEGILTSCNEDNQRQIGSNLGTWTRSQKQFPYLARDHGVHSLEYSKKDEVFILGMLMSKVL